MGLSSLINIMPIGTAPAVGSTGALHQSFQSSLNLQNTISQNVDTKLLISQDSNVSAPIPSSLGNFYNKSSPLAQLSDYIINRQSFFTAQLNKIPTPGALNKGSNSINQSLYNLQNLVTQTAGITGITTEFSLLGNTLGSLTQGVNSLLRQG
jgi:hypothetical protein